MAKVDILIPEPTPMYNEENQRQVSQTLQTLKDKLNTSYQQEIKNELDAFNYFLSWQFNIAAKSQVNATPQGLNLEAGDAITVAAASGGNKIQGAISFALIDRSQENG